MEVSNSTFENNNALIEGGVLKFDSYWPVFSNCTYKDNFAPYGNIMASYPVEIMLSNHEVEIASG